MGGRIGVESRLDHGSVFRVDLPFPRVADVAPQPVDVPAATTRRDEDRPIRILAAEDNPTNQRVLRAVLDTFGVDLTVVENGLEAVQAWRSGHFDVILMDIQMPEMDGAAATRAIRSAERAEGRPRTPILALSANAMTHQVSEYLAAGMDAHLAKPIEIPKLQAALEAALTGSLDAAPAAA
jgi:CheY-like chemotaxis protein